jgi:hypothetical protein
MAFPIKVCSICSEEFELKPGKPGYANQCPACSAAHNEEPIANDTMRTAANNELNAERRKAIRNLLYRRDT